MKILLTGASGFLGRILFSEWKNKHEVIRIGRGEENEILADLTKPIASVPKTSLVVHVAAKAHTIPSNKSEEAAFYQVNVTGTSNLLNALQNSDAIPEVFVFISSVSVYGLNSGENIDESFPLNAVDAYGKSKIESEKLVEAWCIKNSVRYYIFRPPLIAGPEPTGNIEAMKKAIMNGYYFSIGNGGAKKSIVRARDLARFIPVINGESGIYNLSNLPHPTLRQLEDILSAETGKKIRSIPLFIAKIAALAGDYIKVIPLNSRRLNTLLRSLTFSDQKARTKIGWDPETFNNSNLFD